MPQPDRPTHPLALSARAAMGKALAHALQKRWLGRASIYAIDPGNTAHLMPEVDSVTRGGWSRIARIRDGREPPVHHNRARHGP